MKTAVRIDTAIDMSADYAGPAMGMDNMDGYSVCAVWSGASPAGTFKLQACNNPFTNNVNQTPDPAAVWVDIPGSDFTVTGDGDYFWNVSDVYYRAYRLVYTRVSGSATATAYLFAKGIQ